MTEEKQVESPSTGLRTGSEAAGTIDSAQDKAEAPSAGSGQVKTYTEEQFKGLLADKQAEVKKRQELERQLAQIKEQKTDDRQQKTEQDAPGDRPLTVSEFQRLMAQERKANAEADFALREKESTEAAMAEYTAEKYGVGLDFASVIAEGEKNLTEGDLLAIKKAKDPAAEKYRRCIMLTGELTERQQALSNAKLLEEIKLTGRVPATGAAVPNASLKDVSQMSDEELDKLAESLS